ncbi:MAG: hypothetical protein H0U67_15535 [Gemmatimonadetes bacterium]|nr:hypothetical protein [Gemmatimonadota bacterium]
MPVPHASRPTWIVPVQVSYADRDPEFYVLALTFIPVNGDGEFDPSGVVSIARVHSDRDGDALVVDAISEGIIDDVLLWLAEEPHSGLQGAVAEIVVERTRHAKPITLPPLDGTPRAPADSHGSNRVFRSEDVVIKLLRRINEGINPEWEIGQALTDQNFPNSPTMLGALEPVMNFPRRDTV